VGVSGYIVLGVLPVKGSWCKSSRELQVWCKSASAENYQGLLVETSRLLIPMAPVVHGTAMCPCHQQRLPLRGGWYGSRRSGDLHSTRRWGPPSPLIGEPRSEQRASKIRSMPLEPSWKAGLPSPHCSERLT
jgi:hypothetical protein